MSISGVEAPTPGFVARARSRIAENRAGLAWWIMLFAAVAFVAAGLYTVVRGFDAKSDVHTQLVAEEIVTSEDAAIPNVPVTDHKTAHAQADAIQVHTLEATGGLTYAQMGRYMSAANRDDPAGTSDEAQALKDDSGNPVPNPLRQVAFQGAMLRSALLSAALAWHVADLAIGVGAFIAGVGVLALIMLALLRPSKQPTG